MIYFCVPLADVFADGEFDESIYHIYLYNITTPTLSMLTLILERSLNFNPNKDYSIIFRIRKIV